MHHLRAVPAHPHSSPTSTTKLSTSTKLPPVLPTPTSPAPASKLPRFLQSPSSATAPSPSPSTARPPPRLPPPRTPPPPPPTRSPAESANASTAPHWRYTCTPPACLAPGVAPVPICELTRPRKGYDSTPNQTSATLRRYPQREAALGVERCSAIDVHMRARRVRCSPRYATPVGGLQKPFANAGCGEFGRRRMTPAPAARMR
ncbi:hypothetical protein B0H11DRAFT_2396712 [Mycena galericulata]|nr:hypothetical protein B0H11DRAFT_2396712 [Mycena galericulata]